MRKILANVKQIFVVNVVVVTTVANAVVKVSNFKYLFNQICPGVELTRFRAICFI